MRYLSTLYCIVQFLSPNPDRRRKQRNKGRKESGREGEGRGEGIHMDIDRYRTKDLFKIKQKEVGKSISWEVEDTAICLYFTSCKR